MTSHDLLVRLYGRVVVPLVHRLGLVEDRVPMRETMPTAGSDDEAGLTSRQRDIALALAAKDAELGRWFRSAAMLVRRREPAAWPELVAHLCRDLMNRAPEYYDVPRPERIEYPDLVQSLTTKIGEIEEIDSLQIDGKALKALKKLVNAQRRTGARPGPWQLFSAAGRAPSTLTVQGETLAAAWTSTQRGFTAAAHMRSRGTDPVPESRVVEGFDRLEDLLAAQLGGVTFWDLDEELQALAGGEPGRAALDRALLLARGDALNGFLRSLSDPRWLAPMHAAKLFDSPTPTEVMLGGGYRATFWEPSRYLVRIAPAAPEAVTEILLDLPTTNNARIHQDVIEAALLLPTRDAVRVAAGVPTLLGQTPRYPLAAAERAGALAVKLLTEGATEPALALVSALLQTEAVTGPQYGLGRMVRLNHLLDSDYSYGEILDAVTAAIVEHAPLDGLAVLIEALAQALAREREAAGREGPEDDSHIWRKAIDDHEQNSAEPDPRDALISAIRDLVLATVSTSPETAGQILAALNGRPELIFRRLALHLVRICDFPDVIEARRAAMLDRDALNDPCVHRELFLLQRDRFGELATDEQAQLGAWINAGPGDEERWAAAFAQFEGRPATAQDLDRRVGGWRQRRLLAIEPWLSKEQRADVDSLNARLGVDDHPEFNSFITVGFRPIELPYDSEQLMDMSVPELLELFASWHPTADGSFLRPDALGMAVEGAVFSNPTHWAALADALAETGPRYRRHLLHGFAAAADGRATFPLRPVLGLADSHLRDGPPATEDDEHRVAGRADIADLLRAVMTWPQIDAAMLPGVWAMIARLAHDQNTPPADDGGQAWSPLDRRLPAATTCSRVHRAAIQYGIVRGTTTRGQDDVNRVRDLIQAAVDPRHERSAAVSAALAHALRELLTLGQEWAGTLLEPLLNPNETHLVEAAWAGVLDQRPVPVDVLRALSAAGAYHWALDHIPASRRFSSDRREQLGRHTLGAALLETPGHENVWPRWHDAEDEQVRAHVVQSVGRDMETLAISADVVAARWRTRIDALPDSDGELAAFGTWFASQRVPSDRAGTLLVDTLTKSGGAITAMRDVLTTAQLVATAVPREVVAAIRLIADGPNAGELSWHATLLHAVLDTVGATADHAAQRDVRQLVDGLAERGLGDFRSQP